MRKRVGILVFPGVEVLDLAGPYEVFAATRIDETRRREEPSPFDIHIVADTREPVEATGGLRVVPGHSHGSCPPLDVLVVPGGRGVRSEMEDPSLLEWIAARANEVELLASVCTGSMLLGRAGLLYGKRATTHHSCLDWMRESFPETTVVEGARVVEEGSLLTAAGISAGIDLGLRIVARLFGEAVAEATAAHMEYTSPAPPHSGAGAGDAGEP